MKNIFLLCIASLTVCLSTADLRALEISVGSASVHPGNTATVDITFSNVPTNPISAFAIYLLSAPSFGVPSVSVATQPNVTLFVDNFSNGVYRVTGLVLNGPNLGNGTIAHLSFTVPPNAGAGVYPIVIAAMPHSAPPGTNPETRSLVTGASLAGTATGGSISVSTAIPTPPAITSITRQSTGVMLLTISGESGVNYRIEASTNLTQWQQVFTTNAMSTSFQFVDIEAPDHARRFYRAERF